MGIQINFYLTPSDQKQLEEKIARIEPMILLPARRTSAPATQSSRAEIPERIVYLVRASDVAMVHYDYIEEQQCWFIDDGRSPVIQLIRCSLDENTLRRGRLWCEHQLLDPHGAWLPKPADFVSWSRRVVGTARKMLSHDKALLAYLGPEAASWRAEGCVTFST